MLHAAKMVEQYTRCRLLVKKSRSRRAQVFGSCSLRAQSQGGQCSVQRLPCEVILGTSQITQTNEFQSLSFPCCALRSTSHLSLNPPSNVVLLGEGGTERKRLWLTADGWHEEHGTSNTPLSGFPNKREESNASSEMTVLSTISLQR